MRFRIVTIPIGNEPVNAAPSMNSAAAVIRLPGRVAERMILPIMVPALHLLEEITPKILAIRSAESR